MRSRCRHENADHIRRGEWLDLEGSGIETNVSQCEQFRCIDCGAWLSLGASNDDSPLVKIEIRAAELAAMPHKERIFGRGNSGVSEAVGWHLHQDGNMTMTSFGHEAARPPSEWTWAGWLAREIAVGDEP